MFQPGNIFILKFPILIDVFMTTGNLVSHCPLFRKDGWSGLLSGQIWKGHHLTHPFNWDARSREIMLNQHSVHIHPNPNFFWNRIYMLWFNFILGFKFYFLLFQTRYHTLPYPITKALWERIFGRRYKQRVWSLLMCIRGVWVVQ